ncbi:MAG: LysM domain-containing protein [Chloroflexota bacterium]|nr:LysM domain-containing protein [Chloroflexota bacterium]
MKLKHMFTVLFALILVIGLFQINLEPTLAQRQCGPNVTHVVQAGQNLFRIALNYGTTYHAVAAANGITDPTRIYPGQVLRMVCATGGTGSTSTATTVTTTVVNPPPPGTSTSAQVIPSQVDCTRFRATHPTSGFTFDRQDFYWDGAPGATSYRVLIFNADLRPGAQVAAVDVPGVVTTTSIPVGEQFIGPGFRFSYRIDALVADTVVCSTPLLTMLRAVAPQQNFPTAVPVVPPGP